MTIISAESQYLTGQYCLEKIVPSVTIITEGHEVESEFQGKKQFKVVCEVICHNADKKQKTWEMNQSCKKILIKVFGPDTKDWMGKNIKLNIVEQNGHQTVYVDELGTRQMNVAVPAPTTQTNLPGAGPAQPTVT